jgi:hypothetical protein
VDRGDGERKAWLPAETLLLLGAMPLLGWAMLANPDRLNPDAVAYLTIARHWLEGNAALAVNGYWGPLFSWLVVPLLALAGDAMAAGRAVMAASALLYIAGGMLLLRVLGLPAAARLAGGLCLLATALGWSVAIMTPDLLVSGLLLLGMALALDARWRGSAARQLAAGVVFGLAYYAKAVALPLGFGLLLACAAWHAVAAGRLAIAGTLRSGAALLLVAAPWIIVLSLHYGTPGFGTSGAINFAIAGPESIRAAGGGLDPHHPAFTQFHAPRAGRVTAWEEPGETTYPSWSPLADAESARHLLWLFRANVAGALGTLRGYDVVPLGLAALLLAPLLAFGGARPWQLGVVPVAMVVAIYLPSIARGETRYFLPAYPFVLAAALGLACALAASARRAARLRAVAVALVAVAFLLPLRHDVALALTGRANQGLLAARAVVEAMRDGGVAGGIGSVGELGFAAIFAAFLLERPFIGTEAQLRDPAALIALGAGVLLVAPGGTADLALAADPRAARLTVATNAVAAWRLR